MLGFSSATDSTGWTSAATPAAAVAVPGLWAPEQVVAAEALFRGLGVAVSKSALFTFVSVQPPSARTAAVVLLSAGAALAPSKSVAEP
jgi:hypothetical protein